ncbi:MAG: fructosamine kinase family protein, partial [Pirellulaceae bacterium]
TNRASFLENFECETDGLEALGSVDAITVPQPIAVGLAGGKAWLVSQWIDQKPRSPAFFGKFGLQLAKLHRETRGEERGWQRDNYLGSAIQKNTARATWPEFFARQRIEVQLRWANDLGYRDTALDRDCQRIIRNMADLLSGREDSTSLLHGDLWSGNYLCDAVGEPVVIDPAVYRGCREAEFGMLKLFGSCPESFYQAYQTAWPMPNGWERRVAVYLLYHLLNHLNLFGSGYLSQCKSVAAEILSE